MDHPYGILLKMITIIQIIITYELHEKYNCDTQTNTLHAFADSFARFVLQDVRVQSRRHPRRMKTT